MSWGMVYGVGVGPGDPDLVTLRAARFVSAAQHVAYFRKAGKPGRARTIAASLLRPGVSELAMEYPVTTEIPHRETRYQQLLQDFYGTCTRRVCDVARGGNDVVVLCEGDPFFYGSFIHLYERLPSEVSVEVVPGITSMSGAWTRSTRPVTRGDDVLTVLTGIAPEAELTRRMKDTDALVVMKLGRQLPKVRRALGESGLLERAYLVEYATMSGERIRRLVDVPPDASVPYFSLIVVHGRGPTVDR